jgi:hypothetical protein
LDIDEEISGHESESVAPHVPNGRQHNHRREAHPALVYWNIHVLDIQLDYTYMLDTRLLDLFTKNSHWIFKRRRHVQLEQNSRRSWHEQHSMLVIGRYTHKNYCTYSLSTNRCVCTRQLDTQLWELVQKNS